VFGYIGLTRLYLQKMKARRSGVIINIIGAGGERLDYDYIAGAAGNAGLMALTRALGGTSPEFGVRVIGVNPGPVATDRLEVLGRKRAATLYGDADRWRETFANMPFGRAATCDEIAATVVFLASDLCSYTSGTIVTIDGGLTHRSQLP
jgi:NAD(P)-dependent dehydrogenase (short-subunit alcohol dehydrogenase family)